MPESSKEVEPKQLFGKTISHPVVSSTLDTTKRYYLNAKEYSSLLKYGCETLESNVAFGMSLLSPRIQPVLETETFKRYSQRADDFSASTLTNLEITSSKVSKVYEASKQKLNDVRVKTLQAAGDRLEELENRLAPLDNYLKNSYVGFPINKTLAITELLCHRFLLEEKQSESESQVGPIKRSRLLSQKLQRETVRRVKRLSARTGENIMGLKYYVTLLQHAVDSIDHRIKSTPYYLNQSLNYSLEKSNHLLQNSTATASNISIRALTTLGDIIDILSQRVPVETLKERGHSLAHLLQTSSPSTIGQQALEKFQGVGSRLMDFLNEHETSKEFVIFACQKVNAAVDAVFNILHIEKTEQKQIEGKKEQESSPQEFPHEKTNGNRVLPKQQKTNNGNKKRGRTKHAK